jgi:hypothetical protein
MANIASRRGADFRVLLVMVAAMMEPPIMARRDVESCVDLTYCCDGSLTTVQRPVSGYGAT